MKHQIITAGNLLKEPLSRHPVGDEFFENLLSTGDVRLERIISTGQTTPEGEWYDQEETEWVALLAGEAEISFEDGEVLKMHPGDYMLIPPHIRHRVTFTSKEPPAVWLALFINKSNP